MSICPNRENFFRDINDFTILKICREKGFIIYEVQFVYARSLHVLHITPGELKGVLEKVNYLTEVEENTEWYNLQTDKFCPDDFYLDNNRGEFKLVVCFADDDFIIPLTKNILSKIFLEQGCEKLRSKLAAEIRDLMLFVESIPDEIKVLILSS